MNLSKESSTKDTKAQNLATRFFRLLFPRLSCFSWIRFLVGCSFAEITIQLSAPYTWLIFSQNRPSKCMFSSIWQIFTVAIYTEYKKNHRPQVFAATALNSGLCLSYSAMCRVGIINIILSNPGNLISNYHALISNILLLTISFTRSVLMSVV